MTHFFLFTMFSKWGVLFKARNTWKEGENVCSACPTTDSCGHVDKRNHHTARCLVSGKRFRISSPSSGLAQLLISSDLILFLSLTLWKRTRNRRKEHGSDSFKDKGTNKTGKQSISGLVIKSPILLGDWIFDLPPRPTCVKGTLCTCHKAGWPPRNSPAVSYHLGEPVLQQCDPGLVS